jgi:hypothetical protein
MHFFGSKTLEIFGIALGCIVVAWLSFVDPIWQAYLDLAGDHGWTSVAATAVGVFASLVGAACAIINAACK